MIFVCSVILLCVGAWGFCGDHELQVRNMAFKLIVLGLFGILASLAILAWRHLP